MLNTNQLAANAASSKPVSNLRSSGVFNHHPSDHRRGSALSIYSLTQPPKKKTTANKVKSKGHKRQDSASHQDKDFVKKILDLYQQQ